MESYPDYSGKGLAHIKKALTSQDKAIMEKFFKHCSITCGERTLSDIEARLLQARDIIGKPYDSWNKSDVEHFTALLNNSKRTQWTKHGTLASFKRFVRWFYKDLNMLENIKLKRASKFNYRRINDSTLLTADEVQRLIRASETLRMKAFIMLLYETGARPEEIRKLKWKDIKFNYDHADVNIFSPKTTQGRTLPIKEAAIHLKRWKQEYCLPEARDSYLIFPGKVNNAYVPDKVMSGAVLCKIIRKLGKLANIDRAIYPYLIRHSRLTALYNQLPEQLVKKFGGHAPDSDMPKIYSHISNKDVKEAMLEKIYHVEEISPEKKHKLEEQIEVLKKRLDEQDSINNNLKQIFDELQGKKKIEANTEFLKLLFKLQGKEMTASA